MKEMKTGTWAQKEKDQSENEVSKCVNYPEGGGGGGNNSMLMTPD